MLGKKKENKVFNVTGWVDRMGRRIHSSRALWIKIGNFESFCLRDEIEQVAVKNPIYIAGLARSGSTILLEFLSRYKGVVSHCYKDYPPVFTPYWWNWFLKWASPGKTKPAERAHRDRILVTPDSPEAMEEILWISFFQDIHDTEKCNVLDEDTCNKRFEAFYKDHIRKLLLVRDGSRYLAKGNYNITRLEYIHRLFPDARFIIPIRDPVDQIKSLMKQHALFCKGEKEDPRAQDHFKRIGHFEFGLDFCPINTVSAQQSREINEMLWNNREIRAWARYWSQIYRYVSDRLEKNSGLKKAVMVVRYEEFCKSPMKMLEAIQEHCKLDNDRELIAEYARKIKPPEYYKIDFTEDELGIIEEETQETVSRYS